MEKPRTYFSEGTDQSVDAVKMVNDCELDLEYIESQYDEKFKKLAELKIIIEKLRNLASDENCKKFAGKITAEDLRNKAKDIVQEYFSSAQKKNLLKLLLNLLKKITDYNYSVESEIYKRTKQYIETLEQAKMTTINKISKTLGINMQGHHIHSNRRYNGVMIGTSRISASPRSLSDGNFSI